MAQTLYVGDLHPTVNEGHIIEAFSITRGFISSELRRDDTTGESLCHGYVTFDTSEHATEAMERMNNKPINGSSIRIIQLQPRSNLFVKNLDASIDNLKLHDIFSEYGNILSAKVAAYEDGKSKGYGYVQFETVESAMDAIEKTNGSTVEGKELYVGIFIKKADRNPADEYTNLYVKNFGQEVTEEILSEKFSAFGKITSLIISKDSNGVSKGFGFVNFENPRDAKRANESMNGTQLGSKFLYVGKAQKKTEREKILQLEYEERKTQQEKYKDTNLYVKNINNDVDDLQLIECFGQYGNVASAKIMRDDKGMSKGFGFVCFSNPEEAIRARKCLNRVFFHGKPLFVANAQSKEERKEKMELVRARIKQNAQTLYPALPYPTQGFYNMYRPPNPRRPNGFAPPVGPASFQNHPLLIPPPPSVHLYPAPGPRMMNRQIYPVMMNSNMIPHHSRPPMPHIQASQLVRRAHPNRNSGSQQNWTGTANGNSMINGGHPQEMDHGPISDCFSRKLSDSSPDEQSAMIGNRLYPLVQKLKPHLAPKIIGKLLEMDISELLVLLESTQSLTTKVEEAMRAIEISETEERCEEHSAQPDSTSSGAEKGTET